MAKGAIVSQSCPVHFPQCDPGETTPEESRQRTSLREDHAPSKGRSPGRNFGRRLPGTAQGLTSRLGAQANPGTFPFGREPARPLPV